MGVCDKTRPDEQCANWERCVREMLAREFEFGTGVAIIQLDTPRHLCNVVM